ncbi:MAG: hypothetical protein A2231_11765 [Candidatus Firestonebacteria bacterium RIFOXYA2_FULL_40_8]|nr:MAG: hypothetical protein A2231_11765 [Candidatus Firestonebacteria bacterium RIFOXYA2_FULL_40_8]
MEKKVCTDIREKFSDYIDELLPESEMADLEMHMKKCPACRKELESFNKTVQALRNLPRYTAHPNIVLRINDRIAKSKRWWQVNPKVLKGTLGTITAVILCIFGIQIYTGENVIDIMKVRSSAKEAQEARKAQTASTAKTEKEARKAQTASTAKTVKEAQEAKKAPEAKKARTVNAERAGKAEEMVLLDKEQMSKTVAVLKMEAAKELRQETLPNEKELKLKDTDKVMQNAIVRKSDDASAGYAVAVASAPSSPVVGSSNAGTYEQKGLYCQNNTAENIVIKDEKALEKLWAKCFPELAKPAIDFKKEMVVAIFLGEQTANPKDISLKEILYEKDKVKVKYGLTAIFNTDTSGRKLSPYCVKALKKSPLPVEFILEKE